MTQEAKISQFSSPEEYHNWLMEIAYQQAVLAQELDEVPIGAVVARGTEILAVNHNRRILDADPTAHAEVLVIREAARKLGDWRLNECTLAVTLEPCSMCAGAIVLARLKEVVFGATDPKAGAAGTVLNICNHEKLNHRAKIISGIQAEKCSAILTNFFRAQRALGKK